MTDGAGANGRGRVALVLPGGGARGAYEVGALSVLLPALEARGERVQLVCGTSVGAINAALLGSLAHLPAEAQAELALERWRSLRRGDVVAPLVGTGLPLQLARLAGDALRLPGVRRGSLLDPRPLQRFLERRIDWDGLHRNVADGFVDAVCVMATQLASGSPVAFVEASAPTRLGGWDPVGADFPYVHVKLAHEHVRASAAMPVVFPAVEVRAPEEARGFYTDGATRLNSPIKPAVELGADRVVVIGFEPLRRPQGASAAAPEHVSPHLVDVLANMLDGLLVDQVSDDVHRLVAINAFFAESIGTGTVPSARAYRTARGRRPYRRIAYAIVTPERPRELGRLALETFANRYGGVRAATAPPDLLLLGRLLRGGTDAGGDLLSFLFFDPAYVEALIEAGRRDAQRWLRRHPTFWCSDGAHDFDLTAVPDPSAQEAASLDEWRSLRRG
ncbi:MAG TPA: patatin-like phospholipase family protein [Conexibacter sp.]|jgi:NTE family protein|nr:patatin-like phospholipase family protein [Conexibacter sp.]